MTLDPRSKYPSRRTYVLKVRNDATAAAPAGLLENVVTGEQHSFANARELLESLGNDIEASGAREDHGENQFRKE